MQIYCIVNASNQIITLFGGPQNPPTPTGYTIMEDTDARYAVWQTAQATLASGRAAFSTAINGGLALTSTGTPALNATYSVTPEACANITGLVAGIVAGMGLPAGGEYLDQSGNPHTFNATQFTAFARAVENFVASCDIALATIEKGGTATWPSNAVTIP